MKQSHIKFICWFSVFLSLFLIPIACNRDLDFEQEKIDQSETTGALDGKTARHYYSNLIKQYGDGVKIYSGTNLTILNEEIQSKTTANKKLVNRKHPIFRLAYSFDNQSNGFIEVPLLYNQRSSMVIMKQDDPDGVRDKEKEAKVFNATFDRLIIYKNKQTGKMGQYIVSFIPDLDYFDKHNHDISHNHLNQLDEDFNGYLEYKDWDGKHLYFRRIENGKSVKKVLLLNRIETNTKLSSPISQKKSASSNSANGTVTPMATVCTTYQIPIYTQVCTSFDPETIDDYCTTQLDHYEYVTDCYDDGSGDDCYPYCGGEDPVGGGGNTGSNPPSNSAILSQIANKPFALFSDVPCEIIRKWISTAKFSPDQSIINRLNQLTEASINPIYGPITQSDIAHIQNINNAYSMTVNMDYFSVTVAQLPIVNGQRLNATEFLNYIRLHINDFTDNTDFYPYLANGINDSQLWSSNNPKSSVIAIDIPGPDNGSVITSYAANDRWTFTTIHEPLYGDHPVSGNRDFGYTLNSNGSYTFYTRGVDRLTTWDGQAFQYFTSLPFTLADQLWTSFQNRINNFVASHGGSSNVVPPEILRPNWPLVKDVIEGRAPLSTLSTDCPD